MMVMQFLRYPNGRRKALTLSYDDGVEQDATLMDILNEYGIRATFNLNSGCFPPEGQKWPEGQVHRRLPASRVKELYADPRHEVSAHCLTHASLTELSPAQIVHEVLADRENLERMFGTLVRGMAYPFGTCSAEVADAVRSAGAAYSRTVASTHRFDLPADWLLLNPTCHHDDPQLFELCDRFLADKAPFGSLLFYLWGHAYEFEANDNWQRIRDFCQRMGGHEDVWYATNIEIVDYVNAGRQLIASADGYTLYNPTAIPLWVEADGKTVEIGAGKTASL